MHVNEHTIEIARPPADLFPYLMEPEKLRRWIGGLLEMEPLDEGGPPRIGSRSRQVIEERGIKWELTSVITELEPDELVELEATSKAFETRMSYRLEDSGGGTRLTARIESQYRPLFARLLGGLVTRHAQHKLEADLQRLKQLAEAS